MKISHFDIPDIVRLTPKRFGDNRGFFSETYRQSWFDEAGVDIKFIQDNHARSSSKGVVRGLHFQYGKNPQAKLIRVVSGAILDVAVDIRHGSPTFGQHVAVELSAENWQQLLVPPGFAHCYCTLTEETEVIYKVDNYYSPTQEAGIRWNDPALKIDWPVSEENAKLSDKDRVAPLLADSPVFFRYQPDLMPFHVESAMD